jgi:hypothetical protein
MKRFARFDPALAARLAFAAWIGLLSVATLLHVTLKEPVPGAPDWLVLTIAGVEAVSAFAFAVRPGGLALAGLCSSFSAASALHLMLGQSMWILQAYTLAAIFLYLLPDRTHREDAGHGKIGSQ